jgi:hypothetical protein
MTLIRHLAWVTRLVAYQRQLIQQQKKTIAALDELMTAKDELAAKHLQRVHLEHQREMHGLVSAWRIHMETPEIDLRDDITALATDLGNQIAALEEHVV